MKIKKIRKGNCLLLLVAAFIIFNFCGCFFEAKADSAEPNLIPVYVQDGDTLWSIVEENYNYNTLEPCLYRSNGASKLCEILEIPNESEAHLLKYMKRNKTDCALKISSSEASITYPNYIQRAISKK